jgi:hypothetical protein
VSACEDLGTSRSMKQEPVSRATGRPPRKGIPLLQKGEEVKSFDRATFGGCELPLYRYSVHLQCLHGLCRERDGQGFT